MTTDRETLAGLLAVTCPEDHGGSPFGWDDAPTPTPVTSSTNPTPNSGHTGQP